MEPLMRKERRGEKKGSLPLRTSSLAFKRCRKQFLRRIRIEKRLLADLCDVDKEIDVVLLDESERHARTMLERHVADALRVHHLGRLNGVRFSAVAHIPATTIEEKPEKSDGGFLLEQRFDLLELENHGVVGKLAIAEDIDGAVGLL